jgi:hypothetical protein
MIELSSRQRIIKAREVGDKLDHTVVRSRILDNLNKNLDCTSIPDNENCEIVVKEKLVVDNEGCREIEKNIRNKTSAKSGMNKENVG